LAIRTEIVFKETLALNRFLKKFSELYFLLLLSINKKKFDVLWFSNYIYICKIILSVQS